MENIGTRIMLEDTQPFKVLLSITDQPFIGEYNKMIDYADEVIFDFSEDYEWWLIHKMEMIEPI